MPWFWFGPVHVRFDFPRTKFSRVRNYRVHLNIASSILSRAPNYCAGPIIAIQIIASTFLLRQKRNNLVLAKKKVSSSSLTQPCDVNNFWSLPYNTVQKCAIYILSGYEVWLYSDLNDESCVQTSNPPLYPCMGFLVGLANLCAHFGWPMSLTSTGGHTKYFAP